MSETAEHADKNVEIWKVKKLIKSLELARGNGTSMISLIIPPGTGDPCHHHHDDTLYTMHHQMIQ